ncbi:hypothetical protein TNCV_4047971 [Trichonephila clavipes]|nr:hypothetical protein TNCV_4047971 [Trichonephila clavipes]
MFNSDMSRVPLEKKFVSAFITCTFGKGLWSARRIFELSTDSRASLPYMSGLQRGTRLEFQVLLKTHRVDRLMHESVLAESSPVSKMCLLAKGRLPVQVSSLLPDRSSKLRDPSQ